MYAFSGCSGLRSITIPNSVTSIKYCAFFGCKNLTSITIPPSVKRIENCAFNYSFAQPYTGKILQLPSLSEDPTEWGLSQQSIDNFKYGLHDSNGVLILDAEYARNAKELVDNTTNTQYYFVEHSGKKGMIDTKGNWPIPLNASISDITLAGNGYFRIKSNGSYGIVNANGKEIISTTRGYTSIGDYDSSKGSFAFTKKGYSGYCDTRGQEISLTKLAPTANDIKANGGYASAAEIKNGNVKYYIVGKGGRYGLADANGKVVIPVEMESLGSAGAGFLKFKSNGFWGIMNFQGHIIIDTTRGYTSIGDYLTSRQRFTYEMYGFKGECDGTGKELSRIKVATPQQNATATNTTNKNSGNSNSGSSTSTVIVEHHRDPIPVQEWQQCANCWGEGKVMCLGACGGTGTYYVGDRLHICSSCNGAGKKMCPYCSGQGGRYQTVYK